MAKLVEKAAPPGATVDVRLIGVTIAIANEDRRRNLRARGARRDAAKLAGSGDDPRRDRTEGTGPRNEAVAGSPQAGSIWNVDLALTVQFSDLVADLDREVCEIVRRLNSP
jgi:hypothetical protein